MRGLERHAHSRNVLRVLGIETSCDETAAAVYDDERGLLAHCVHSQVARHRPFGGVVPELASRDHVRFLLPLVRQALEIADSSSEAIGGIAYTAGPGLIGALLVGAAFARGLGLAWGKPVVGVHHLEGHLLAPLLERSPPSFPFMALLVSGGHTQLIDVAAPGEYQILGESLDDAAGEAFDKVGKLLGLAYPAGAALEQLARAGRRGALELPRPMLDRPGLDFSFSGLKTAVVMAVRNRVLDETQRADVARGFEESAVEVLVEKSRRALEQSGRDVLVAAGGVAANSRLRAALTTMAASRGARVFFPRAEFCTDNGAMIALAGWYRLRSEAGSGAGERTAQRNLSGSLAIEARAAWPLGGG